MIHIRLFLYIGVPFVGALRALLFTVCIRAPLIFGNSHMSSGQHSMDSRAILRAHTGFYIEMKL